MRRWKPPVIGKKLEVDLVLRVNNVQVNNDQRLIKSIIPETRCLFQQFWTTYRKKPLVGRDIILQSFCPQVRCKKILVLQFINFVFIIFSCTAYI